jgi:hypothetical protein
MSVKNGWKLESKRRTRDGYRCVFVRVEPSPCGNCGELLPHGPTCPKCGCTNLCWCAVGTQITNLLHASELRDWR